MRSMYTSGFVQYTISPTLPAGITIDMATGTISGTPTAPCELTIFTVLGWNAAGELGSGTVRIAVEDKLVYTPRSVTVSKGKGMTSMIPNPGFTNFVITPTLPKGISLHKDGIIVGVADDDLQEKTYTVMATSKQNIQYSTTVEIRIVEDLSYSTTIFTALKNLEIPPFIPTAGFSHFWVTPLLPAGIELDSVTGVISGTPTETSKIMEYTIGAKGDDFVKTTILLSVADSLAYTPDKQMITKNHPMKPMIPTYRYKFMSISPQLPAGITVDTDTGVISGTPVEPMREFVYTVAATSPEGEFEFTEIRISVTPDNEFDVCLIDSMQQFEILIPFHVHVRE